MEDRACVLLLALHRPTLYQGVPLEGMLANCFGSLYAGMIFQGPEWYRCPLIFWAMGVPVHFLMKRVVAWDYHGFRIIRLFLESLITGPGTLDPIPARTSAKDIPYCG